MPNRLIKELSPYLLQHAHNPVDWYAWGLEAFEAARREDKPIFLSIGYATCHWCHVMERESFEDNEAATALNQSFICIKVDREERPDIDAVYMAACQMVTGSGGWPLTIVMTPEKKPFFAATYLPKQSMMGRLGLLDLCERIHQLWARERGRVLESAQVLSGHLAGAFEFERGSDLQPDLGLIDQAVQGITSRFDAQFGGFDGAPKFPTAHRLLFLMNVYQRQRRSSLLDMISQTLTAMRLGGLWDHVGFGFHRYATDRQWLLPHFEKMLYDQALLAMAYLKGFELTGNELFAQTARQIFTYVLRDMTDNQGGFYTAEDADSEGEEGKFYIWSQHEFDEILAPEANALPWTKIFNLHPDGNFHDEATRSKTGLNILHLTRPWEAWAESLNTAPQELSKQWEVLRQRLFDIRKQRIAPLKDDKILTDWNGLMIAALAQGAGVLKEKTYLDAAHKAAEFILGYLRDDQGRLRHRCRSGQAAINATANDYACLIWGLLELHRADGNPRWSDSAVSLQQAMTHFFWDQEKGGFFLSHVEQHELPVRPNEIYYGALPSANAVALHNLLELHRFAGESRYLDQARQLIQAFGGSVQRQPSAFLHTLDGWAKYIEGVGERGAEKV